MSARQSVYPSADILTSQNVLNNLNLCIGSVDLSCRTLESINEHLQGQTEDFARFSRVIRSKKHFDLISEKEIQEAKSHLSVEIAPQLKELIIRAEEALQKEERKSKTLKSKAAQQSLRLEQVAQLHGIPIERLTTNDSQLQVSQENDIQIEALHISLRELQAERITKQREMDILDRQIRREREAR